VNVHVFILSTVCKSISNMFTVENLLTTKF